MARALAYVIFFIFCNFGLRLIASNLPPNLQSHSRANIQYFPLKIQINLIFTVKSLHISNICCKFARNFVRTYIKTT